MSAFQKQRTKYEQAMGVENAARSYLKKFREIQVRTYIRRSQNFKGVSEPEETYLRQLEGVHRKYQGVNERRERYRWKKRSQRGLAVRKKSTLDTLMSFEAVKRGLDEAAETNVNAVAVKKWLASVA